MDTKGGKWGGGVGWGGGGGMNWEIGIDIYTLIRIQQITNKKLLYKKINKIKFKNSKKRDFPGGAVVKNPPANAGDTGLIPGPGRSHILRSN